MACGNNPDADNQTLFQALTANTWCNEPKGSATMPPDTSKTYAFIADGTYQWGHHSDVPEGSGKGTWNWRLATPNSGLILLSEGDALNFSLNTDRTLSLETMELKVCEALGEVKGKTARDLPQVEPSDLFKRLTANVWDKTSELNAARVPSSLKFEPDGEYEAIFRDGECTFRGTWSLRENQLRRSVTPDACVPGVGSNVRFFGGPVEVKGALTLIESTLYSPQPRDKATSTAYLRMGELEGSIRYAGELQPARPSTLTITIENRSKSNVTLNSFRIVAEALQRTADGYQSGGPKVELTSLDLEQEQLLPGQSNTFMLEVTSPGYPEMNLSFDLKYTAPQPRSNPPQVERTASTSFMVDFRPK